MTVTVHGPTCQVIRYLYLLVVRLCSGQGYKLCTCIKETYSVAAPSNPLTCQKYNCPSLILAFHCFDIQACLPYCGDSLEFTGIWF